MTVNGIPSSPTEELHQNTARINLVCLMSYTKVLFISIDLMYIDLLIPLPLYGIAKFLEQKIL